MARLRIGTRLRLDPELAQYLNRYDWELIDRKLEDVREWARARVKVRMIEARARAEKEKNPNDKPSS